MNEQNNRENTPVWKRVLALLGVAVVIGFVAWLFFSMMSV